MNEAQKIDELVWELVGKAHQLNEVKYQDTYPELKLFIEYLITHYPAKDPNEIVQSSAYCNIPCSSRCQGLHTVQI